MQRSVANRGLMLVLCLQLTGCNQLLGVETLANTRDDAGASGAGAADTGTSPQAGGSGGRASGPQSAGAGSDAGVEQREDGGTRARDAGGAAGARSEAGSGGAGSTAMDAAGPDAAVEGGSGGAAPGGMRVRGRLIDFWRKPVADVAINLGKQSVRSGADGSFSIDAPSAPYDLSVTNVVTFVSGNTRTYRHLFHGLTRSDPTLQIDLAPDAHQVRIEASFSGVNFPLAQERRLELAFGSPLLMWNIAPDASDEIAQPIWYGPSPLTGSIHLLSWTVDAGGLPSTYDTHTVQRVELSDAVTTPITAIANSQTIESALVAGHVNVEGSRLDRQNHVYVRFDDFARIETTRQLNAADDFSVLVPKLEGSSILLAASVGDYDSGPFAVAHRANLSPGPTPIELTIPRFPSLIAPADNATGVGPETRFEWSGEDAVHVLYVTNDASEAVRIISAESSTRLPLTASGDFAFDPSKRYGFWVEIHGAYASVDDATGPSGFLDDYASEIGAPFQDHPFGIPREAGRYASTNIRYMTLASP